MRSAAAAATASARPARARRRSAVALPRISLTPVWYYDGAGQIDTDALQREMARRAVIRWRGARDPDLVEALQAACREHAGVWFDQFLWAFDPRARRHLPMVLWPRQREYLAALQRARTEQTDLVVEKSRDCGVTTMNMGDALRQWLLTPGYKATFIANLQALVDTRDDPDSIFEKGRMMLRRLPDWMLPDGFDVNAHALICRIINPANGNVLVGNGGDNAGRGGRASEVYIDEAAHIARAKAVDAATSATAHVRVWASSVNGTGNLFYQKRKSGRAPVFVFDYHDDPRKTEAWAAAEIERITPTVFAQEYGRDYGASLSRLVIARTWIDSSLKLRALLESRGERPAGPAEQVGADVGKGVAENVLVARTGPWVQMPVAWRDKSTSQTAMRALAYIRDVGARTLCYDAVGVGEGLTASFDLLDDAMGTAIVPVSVGEPASGRLSSDGREARARFSNLKAELWWDARERLERTHARWLHEQGEEGGAYHATELLMLLPDDETLLDQLNTPLWFEASARRVAIESKDQLAKRGVPSPDRADALVLAFHEPQTDWQTWVGD